MDYIKYYENQAGGNDPYSVFRGSPFQRGYGLGGIFKKMYRFFMPIMNTHALPALKRGAEIFGAEAVKAASNVAQDVIKGSNVQDALRHHTSTAIENLNNKVQTKLQSGAGKNNKERYKNVFTTKKKKPETQQKRKILRSISPSFSLKKIKRESDIFD